jgi:hypothetical protein
VSTDDTPRYSSCPPPHDATLIKRFDNHSSFVIILFYLEFHDPPWRLKRLHLFPVRVIGSKYLEHCSPGVLKEMVIRLYCLR